MKVDLAAALLVDGLGHIQAHKHALREQQKARRARSRKRFAFWMSVASEIKNFKSVHDENEKPLDGRFIESVIVLAALSVRPGSARSKFPKNGQSPVSLQRSKKGNTPWLSGLRGVTNPRPEASTAKRIGLASRQLP